MIGFKDGIKVTGDVSITVYDTNGNVKETRDIKNLIVTTGKQHIASRIAGTFTGEGAAISHMGFGISTTTPVLTDTNLITPLGVRVPISSMTHTAGTNTVTVTASFTGYAGNITEAGMFNALTSGTMICRTTFGAVSVLATDGLAIVWTLNIN